MSRMLQNIPKFLQWPPASHGGSARHARDMNDEQRNLAKVLLMLAALIGAFFIGVWFGVIPGPM